MKISIFPSQTVIRNRPDGGAVAAPFQPLYQRIKTIVLRRFQEGERRRSQGDSERDPARAAQSGESGHGTQGGRKTDAGYLLVTEPTPLVCVDQVARTYCDRSVQFRRRIYRTDRHSYANSLSRC